MALLVILGACVACNDTLNPPLPAGTEDPGSFENELGALGRYRETVRGAATGLAIYAVESGVLTDELQENTIGGGYGTTHPMDERMLPEGSIGSTVGDAAVGPYQVLQRMRGNSADAIGYLRSYAPDQPTALMGELYALQAYAEIGLADLFCSGVPLSTLDFGGDFTYRPGSSTSEIYEHAIALFDTAMALSADSARILDLARIGKGRALLDLGRYADAAGAVADVPEGFHFQFSIDWRGELTSSGVRAEAPLANVTMADGEGTNGLDFISSGDPRTTALRTSTNSYGVPIYQPQRYQAVAPFTIADWIEARLIQAEAALQSGDPDWLTTLDALRTDGTYETYADPDDSTKTDTLWNAGSAGVAGLAPFDDPGSEEGRVDLLFHERAFWLFLTGHRQGDLRRMLRQYGRDQSAVYPTGLYPGGQGVYGSDVNAAIPPAEYANPLFTGCLNRDP